MTRKRLIMLAGLVAALAALSIGVAFGYFAWRSIKLAAACDQLAGHPNDKLKVPSVAGVPFELMEFERAIPACYEAVLDQPGNGRLSYQYGRALDAGNQGARAVKAYGEAFELGHSMAAYNLGIIHQTDRGGVQSDSTLGLQWYERAAELGIQDAQRQAAQMLSKGESLSTPNAERAAKYWRALADSGDAEAAESLALAIINKSVQPINVSELDQRLREAADKGRFVASLEYAKILFGRDRSKQNLEIGARYALAAYRISVDAPLSKEEAWLLHQRDAFLTYKGFVSAGAPNAMQAAEYKSAVTDFPETTRKFTIPIDCDGKKVSFDFYLWQWSRSYPQTDPQAAWLKQARGCIFPQEALDSFRRLLKIAVENNANYPDLVKYALEPDPPATAQQSAPVAPVAATPVPASSNEQLLKNMQEAEARRAQEERSRHEESIRVTKEAAKQQCLAQQRTCSSQCGRLRGAIESDPWYKPSPRTVCQIDCTLIKCD